MVGNALCKTYLLGDSKEVLIVTIPLGANMVTIALSRLSGPEPLRLNKGAPHGYPFVDEALDHCQPMTFTRFASTSHSRLTVKRQTLAFLNSMTP